MCDDVYVQLLFRDSRLKFKKTLLLVIHMFIGDRASLRTGIISLIKTDVSGCSSLAE